MLKTKSIDKQLKAFRTAQNYNKTKDIYISKLSSAYISMLDDNVRTSSFFKDVLRLVLECKIKYKSLLSFSDKILIYQLKIQLRKTPSKIDVNKAANYLATLTARLTKTEEEKL